MFDGSLFYRWVEVQQPGKNITDVIITPNPVTCSRVRHSKLILTKLLNMKLFKLIRKKGGIPNTNSFSSHNRVTWGKHILTTGGARKFFKQLLWLAIERGNS